MSRCKGCGGEYRKGTTAVLFGQDGSFKPARVCPKCIARGLTIVACFVPPVVKEVKQAPADLQGAIRTLRTWAKLSASNGESAGAADGREHFRGRAEGLESALELLEKLVR